MFEIGVDIEDIERFKKYSLEKDYDFLTSIFSKKELEYCYSKKLPAKHLAARFCAKEAFFKAVSEFDLRIAFNQIEIINKKSGKPDIKLPKEVKGINCKVSLSHDKTKAIASVIVTKDTKI